MEPAVLIARYGLLAVFAGTLFEGETLLVLAGYAAHRGYLDFGAVVAVAVAGAVLGDQFWFWLGRRHGGRLFARRPAFAARVSSALALIGRHPQTVVLAMRFLWGLRIALPVAIGMSGIGRLRYLALNLLSALLWAPLVAGVGYLSGAVLAPRIAELHRYEAAGMAFVLAAAVLWRLVARWRHGKLRR